MQVHRVHIASFTSTAGTVRNALAHVRTFFKISGIPDAALYAPQVRLAVRAMSLTLRCPKAPAYPDLVARALHYRHHLRYPCQIRVAVTFMLVGFFRQSNIAPPSSRRFDPTRQLIRDDVVITSTGLSIHLKWSKTMQKSSQSAVIFLPDTATSVLCPRRVYRDLIQTDPPASGRLPLLRFQDGNPMPVYYITQQWATLLRMVGVQPRMFSLHSLRRGGASYAYHSGGAAIQDIMSHGTWASDAVRAYLIPGKGQLTSAHKAIKTM